MPDVIIVGARCAGSPLAMLVARLGHSALVVDRATFPSDTVSTHYIAADGVARLQAWGLYERVLATGVEAYAGVSQSMQGMTRPRGENEPLGVAPRRTVLDKLLVDAARESGAEVREGVTIDGLIREGEVVVGVHGRAGGEPFEERARVVVGADGRESFMARQVEAGEYNHAGGTTFGYYAYFKNFAHDGPEMHVGGGAAHFAFPTNDGEVCLAVEKTAPGFKDFREDIEGNFAAQFRGFPPFAERFAKAERTSKIFGLAPHKSFYRKPYGPGWALVGDAGYYRDPLLGQGINDAFRDAENLANALDAVFTGRESWETALAGYEKARNDATAMMYGLTNLLCQDLDPSPQVMQMMAGGPPPPASG